MDHDERTFEDDEPRRALVRRDAPPLARLRDRLALTLSAIPPGARDALAVGAALAGVRAGELLLGATARAALSRLAPETRVRARNAPRLMRVVSARRTIRSGGTIVRDEELHAVIVELVASGRRP